MNRVRLAAIGGFALFVGAARPNSPPASPGVVSLVAARLIADAIPREYERSKDWGRTRRITTGLRSSGNFFDFDIHRRKSEVNHGVWKKYRVTLVEPDKHLIVSIENLRGDESGHMALTLFVNAKLEGWARVKVYDHGIHLIALEGEVDASVRLWIDCDIAVAAVPGGSFLPGVAIRPVVTDARLKLDEFRLRRISDLRGSVARELGDGLRRVIADELAGPKLVAKLNKAIAKRGDKLQITPDMLQQKIIGQ